MKEVKPPKKPLIYYYGVALVVLLLINFLLVPLVARHAVQEVDYGTFMTMTENKEIGQVEVEDNQIIFTNKDGSKVYKTGPMNDPDLTQRLYDAGAEFTRDIVEETSPLLSFVLTWILPIIIFIAIGQLMTKKLTDRAGGPGSMMFGAGKSNAKIYVQSSQGIHFSDVAGEDEAKENLQEIVNYLHDPGKYQEIGASMPKGILLVGPPGTGKTMLAKAVAGESQVPFFSISGSEFVEMFVGMGASKVRDLFSQAKEKAPCIVFIDEIDAIGQKRSGGQYGGNDEREQTLNQLLTEMDGFEGNNGVIILAATNRPESLDPALTRPGRFDRRVPVELPDLKGREAILQVHAKKIKVAEDVDFNKIARMASGASGAELANIVNEAALRAVRDGRRFATQADLEESIEVVIAGYQKKNAIMTDEEKKIVSYHEIGHALVAAMQTLCGAAGFTEMYMMDFKREAILMCHQGEGNWRLCRGDRRPYLKNRVLSEGGLSNPPTPIFTPEPGRACILSLTHLTADRFRLVCAPGEILPDADLLHVDMPYLFFRPDSGVRSCVTAWLEQGGTHHEALVLGDRLDRIRLFCRLWNVEFVQL